eukprot:symbB.v1.2.022391.t1/scaffold1983.1/size166549/7
MSDIDVNDAFAKRMAQVQAELQQMQQVQSELKGQEAKYLKAVQGYQKDLENIARQIGHAQSRRQKILKELEHCNEEIRDLEKKKEETARKMCEVTTEAERVRSEKLNAASENLHLSSKPAMSPSNAGVNLCDLLEDSSTAKGAPPPGGALDLLQFDPGAYQATPAAPSPFPDTNSQLLSW